MKTVIPRFFSLFVSCGCAAFFTPTSAVHAAAGDLDTTFNGTGQVAPHFVDFDETSEGMVIQSDGKVVLGGHTWNGTDMNFALMRFLPNGALDTGFGGDGKADFDLGTGTDDFAYQVAAQTDGKLLLVGSRTESGANSDLGLIRSNADGTIDTGFGVNGVVITNFDSGTNAPDYGRSVRVQGDGKIVVAGNSRIVLNGLQRYCVALARYNTDGSLDGTFGSGGLVVFPVVSEVTDMVIQSDGKILISGFGAGAGITTDGVLVRSTAGGSLDTSFNGTGVVFYDLGEFENATCVTVQTDGKILLGGYSNDGDENDMFLVRYNDDGSLDTTFAGDGSANQDFPGSTGDLYSLAVQPDGKIVGAGSVNAHIAVVRYLANGTLDTSFHGDGIATTATNDRGRRVALQADGKIVASGFLVASEWRFTASRFEGDSSGGTPDPDPVTPQPPQTIEAYYAELASFYENLSQTMYQFHLNAGDKASAEFNLYYFRGQSLNYFYLSQGNPKLGRFFQFLNLAKAHKRKWILKGNPAKGQQLFAKYRAIALRAKR